MTKFLVSALFLLSLSLAAFESPNMYQCKGKDVDFSYQTTGWTGKPSLNLDLRAEELYYETKVYGNDIRTTETDLGKLVSFDGIVVPDLFSIKYTVLLPIIQLANMGKGFDFSTMLIETRWLTSFAGTDHLVGAITENTYIPVECTASSVLF